MVKSIILILVLGIAIVFSGCTGTKDVTSSFKAIPEVQQFLSEHPTAKITMTYWSKEEVEKSANEINQQCDKTITPVAMYKATVSEGDLKIISWINADTQIVMCSVTQRDNDLIKPPTQTMVQTPKRNP
jgi:predicted lipoprotein with Yx(FWY)xxD motif